MGERTIERDEPVMDEQGEALRHAMERAERAEAELAKLKSKSAHKTTSHAEETKHAASKHLVEPGSMDRSKQPAAQEPEGHAVGEPQTHGIAALREDSMMAHLLDALERGEDIGHYGRLKCFIRDRICCPIVFLLLSLRLLQLRCSFVARSLLDELSSCGNTATVIAHGERLSAWGCVS